MNGNAPFCQSCGMPMLNAGDFGSSDYCHYCYKNGQFTKTDITMEQMIERLLPFAAQIRTSEDEARKMGQENLPKLKNW